MLQSVPALVSRDGGGSDVALVVNDLAVIDGLVGGIVVVGETPRSADNPDIVDTTFTKHPLCNLAGAEKNGNLRVLDEFALQTLAQQPIGNGRETLRSGPNAALKPFRQKQIPSSQCLF